MNNAVAEPLSAESQPTLSLASILFVAILLFALVSLHVYADLTEETGSSLALDQLTALTLTASGLLYVVRAGLTSLIMQPRAVVILVFAWLAFTSLGAEDVMTALRRLFVTWLFCLSASLLLVLPRDRKHFCVMLAFCTTIVLALCYFGVVAMPMRSIHQASDVVEPALAGDWRGVFEHKNIAAPAMVILVFFSLYIAARWSAWIGWTLAALAMIFLFKTNGKSAIGLFPLAMGMAMVLVRWPRVGALLFVCFLLGFNGLTLGSALVPAIRNFVASLGVDATFTSRTDVWSLAAGAIMERPLLGYGFDSFWGTGPLLNSEMASQTWAVAAAHAHNSYLEVMLDGGVPALVLTLAWLILLPSRDIARAAQRNADPSLTLLYTRIWVFALISACMESNFFKTSGMMWFVLLISVFGLHFQAEADLAADETAHDE